MKKILLYALLILLIAYPVFPMNTAILSGSGEGSAATSYIMQETFDGVGTDQTWTDRAGTGTWDTDYAAGQAPLEGTHSLQCVTEGRSLDWSGVDTTYITFMVSLPANSTANYLFDLSDGTDAIGKIRLGDVEGTKYFELGYSGAASYITGSNVAISANTTYYIKIKYVKGTGANASWQLWVSTDGSNWTDEGSVANASDTTQLTRLQTWGSYEMVIDDVRVDESDINY